MSMASGTLLQKESVRSGRRDIDGKSIDDVLGGAENRFFGEGYKRVTRELTNAAFSSESELGMTAAISLGYPGNWSKKAGQQARVPHLSTVDGLVFGVLLADIFLTSAFSLDDAQRSRSWIKECTIKGGALPNESLEDLNTKLVWKGTRKAGSILPFVSTLALTLGGMRVDIVVEHEVNGVRCALDIAATEIESIIGSSDGPWWNNYLATRQEITGLSILQGKENSCGKAVRACVTWEGGASGQLGLEGAYVHSPLSVDAMVVLASLAQVLMYEMDNLHRSETETLWMRRFSIRNHNPGQLTGDGALVRAEIVKASIRDMQGSPWRLADLSGRYLGFTSTASLAHRLPNS